jgi:hypothetical protein
LGGGAEAAGASGCGSRASIDVDWAVLALLQPVTARPVAATYIHRLTTRHG